MATGDEGMATTAEAIRQRLADVAKHTETPKGDLFLRFMGLCWTYKTYNDNYLALDRACMNIEAIGSAERLHRILVTGDISDYLAAVRTHLYNFVVSSATLIEHCRSFVDHQHKSDAFRDEYQNRVDADFGNNKLAVFVKNLRNCAVHYMIPISVPSMTLIEEGRLVVGCTLPTSELRRFAGWQRPALDYLTWAGREVSVSNFASEYWKMTERFYRWFFARQEEMHEAVLTEQHRLQSEISTLLCDLVGLEVHADT